MASSGSCCSASRTVFINLVILPLSFIIVLDFMLSEYPSRFFNLMLLVSAPEIFFIVESKNL